MKKAVRCLLSVFLCIGILAGLLPGAAAETVRTEKTLPFAQADEQGTVTYHDKVITTERALPGKQTEREMPAYPVSTMSIGVEGGSFTFTTFADLQALAAESFTDYTPVIYTGAEPLVIETDLMLPQYLLLFLSNGELVVPAGVNFAGAYIYANRVTVEGTLECAYMEVYEALTVAGTLYNDYVIHIEETASVSGLENIRYDYSGGSGMVVFWNYITDMAELRSAVNTAQEYWDDHWRYALILDQTDILVDGDITIPDNCELGIDNGITVTVAEGVTLNLACYTWVKGWLVVNGTLHNGYALEVFYDEAGRLQVGDGGTYAGSGHLLVFSAALSDPSAAVPGLGNYTSAYYNDSYGRYWELFPAEAATALSSCEWGVDHTAQREVPGFISWKTGSPDTGNYLVRVYRDGAFYEEYGWTFKKAAAGQWRSIDSFCNSDPESGSYYFTVTPISESGEYVENETVTSPVWEYTQPSQRIGICTNLRWNWPETDFEEPADMTFADGYEIQIYYGETEEAEPSYAGTSWGRYASGEVFIADVQAEGKGAGYYYYKVRLLSSDITKACNGGWSELSEAYHLTETEPEEPEQPTELQLPFTEAEWEVLKLVNEERRKVGAEPLTGFPALQDATYIRAAEMWEQYSHYRPDGTVCFTVLEEFGLRYNSAGENIAYGYTSPEGVMNGWMNSPPHRENILSTDYDCIGVGQNGVYWVQMFLGGGSYTSLDVVPPEGASVEKGTDIDDMDLVAVLNSSFYGECYLPVSGAYCTGYDPDRVGKQTVTVSVLGVTDTFEITVSGLRGDVNGDDRVTEEDAIYLLWHTLFRELYPIGADADFNGDRQVTDADAMLLLWFTLFPDQYPL